jgi:hypothetical protein
MTVENAQRRMLRRTLAGLTAAACLTSVGAEEVPRPLIKPGDTWTYRLTTQIRGAPFREERNDLLVTRVTPSSIYYSLRPTGTQVTPQERFTTNDWGRVRTIDGKEVLISQPITFPLEVGRTWDVQFTDPHPGNRGHTWEKVDGRYTVVGMEPVEVPAGKFNALKIEREGHWTAELAPRQAVVQAAQSSSNGVAASTQIRKVTPEIISGRQYTAYWYAPEVKRWVKSVSEIYDTGGKRSEFRSEELESFHLAP